MSILYQVLILPIETVMERVLSSIYAATGSYGLSIFLLSLIINVSLLPLFHLAERWQEAERNVQKMLKPKIKEFRQAFSGEERHAMIHTLYRQTGYHPIYAMRGSVGLLLQLPFWIAAYQLLSRYTPLNGASFLVFDNLGEPDRLLWGWNALPLIMTALNVAAAFVYTKSFSRLEQVQPLVLASLFLILLYSSPSGLLLYWTFNSLFSLIRIMAYARGNVTHATDVGSVEESGSFHREPPIGKSGMGTLHRPIGRDGLPHSQRILESPYVFGLLAGLWPGVSYISNNWFMFEASRIPIIIFTFSAVSGLFLGAWYLALSWLSRRGPHGEPSQMALRGLVFAAILMMAFLLRRTLLAMVAVNEFVFLLYVFAIAATVGWFAPRVRIGRLNVVLGIMCLVHVVMGLSAAIASNSGAMVLFDEKERAARQAVYDRVQFAKTPNVYYIVPDAYPNAEALKTIFGLNAADLYERLKASGFTIYPSVFSNYMSTLTSISSVLGMDHHYYRGSIGNFEILNGRQFIVSQQNPVVRIFRNNGYRIHYVHETDYLFSSGCFVDSCSPMGFLGEFREILLPASLNALPLLGNVLQPITAGRVSEDLKETRSEFMERVERHIETMSRRKNPHFTYIHGRRPGHSFPGQQTAEQLAGFRKEYAERIQLANEEVMSMVQNILARDPSAVIILNADHGAWGHGNFNYTQEEILEEVPDDLMALDHLGVLLAIRWADSPPPDAQDIRTNVNIFPHVFSHLSGSQAILAVKAPDDGYVARGWGVEQTLRMAIQNGRILEHLIGLEQREEAHAPQPDDRTRLPTSMESTIPSQDDFRTERRGED
jgi:YidC/Oxa1 family membrane protein insertase